MDCLHQIQIFFWICPFSNLLRKTNVLRISELLSVIVTFWLKREVFSEFSRKCFKTTEKHSLAVCGSFWGEKKFLIIFVPFYCFDPKSCLQQIHIFLWIFSFSNLLKKIIFLSNSDFFRLKREIFSEFPQKFFKSTEKHSLAVCVSFWGVKQFLFIFLPYHCFVQKGLFTTNPNFPLDLPLFKFVEKNKLSKYFWVSFWESQFFDQNEKF